MIICFFFSEYLVSIFSNEKPVIRICTEYLKIFSWSFPFVAYATILNFSLSGAGETKPGLIATIFTIFAIRIPLVYIIPTFFSKNTIGLWYALSMSNIINGLLMYLYYRYGSWKTRLHLAR